MDDRYHSSVLLPARIYEYMAVASTVKGTRSVLQVKDMKVYGLRLQQKKRRA